MVQTAKGTVPNLYGAASNLLNHLHDAELGLGDPGGKKGRGAGLCIGSHWRSGVECAIRVARSIAGAGCRLADHIARLEGHAASRRLIAGSQRLVGDRSRARIGGSASVWAHLLGRAGFCKPPTASFVESFGLTLQRRASADRR